MTMTRKMDPLELWAHTELQHNVGTETPGGGVAPRTPDDDISGLTVLVCDDEAIVVEVIARCLVRIGLVVLGQATNGTDAVELVKRLTPDLVTMDLDFADGINGIEACQRIQAVRPTCVLFISGRHPPTPSQASGFLGKWDMAPIKLERAVRQARRTFLTAHSAEPAR